MAQVTDYKKDRTGKLYADKYSIRFSGPGDRWQSKKYGPLRKLYVANGPGVLKIYLGRTSGSIGGTSERTLQPGEAVHLGSPTTITFECVSTDSNGDASVYVHFEWNHG